MKKIISVSAYVVSLAVFAIGLFFFVYFNHGIFFSTAAMAIIFALLVLTVPVAYLILRKKEVGDSKVMKIIPIVVIGSAILMLFMTVLYSVIVDYFQPVSINQVAAILLITGSVLLLISSVLSYFLCKDKIMSIIVPVMLIATMSAGYIWSSAQGFQDYENIDGKEIVLFDKGEAGYTTFRIPSLYAIDHDILNDKAGTSLESDFMIALAEGRRDSSHDMGRIDLVMKTSVSGGAVWSDVQVLKEFTEEDGKYGNPTVIFNEVTGELNIAYMSATTESGYDYNAFNGIYTIGKDLSLTLIETINMSLPKGDETSNGIDGVRKDTLMIGPGKGTQMTIGGINRLILPCSNDGNSFIMYSDDNGRTWNKGASAGEGNECEATVLANDELVMVVRDNIGGSAYHPKQYQRLSFSKDGGKTWYITTKSIVDLKSSICMSSVDTMSNGNLVMTYPNAFGTRANLTYAVSADNGESWTNKLLYGGAAGYSCVTIDSADNVYVLSEVGAVNYNEVLTFMKVNTAV